MRTNGRIIIIVLTIIILITSTYIIVKYGKKYFGINWKYEGGLISGKSKNTRPVQKQESRWRDPNSMRRQVTDQAVQSGVSTFMNGLMNWLGWGSTNNSNYVDPNYGNTNYSNPDFNNKRS